MATNNIPEEVIKKIEVMVEKYSFQVPYDGSNNFYNEEKAIHYEKGLLDGYSLSQSHPSASIEDAAESGAKEHFIKSYEVDGFSNLAKYDSFKFGFTAGASWQASQQTPAPIQEEQEELELWEEFFERWQLFCGQEKRLGNNISVGEFYNDEKQEYSLIKK